MNARNIFYCLLAVGMSFGCSNVYEETDYGVIVKVKPKDETNAHLVRIEVMGDKLFHVSATKENKFADSKSLIIVPQTKKIPFTVKQQGDTVIVSTGKINASVLSSTGEVWFTNKKGEIILQENKGGGKTFIPIEIEGTKGYSIRQVFESPKDEAFYGLGQHQSEEFNYKGKNEALKFQYLSSYLIKTMVFCWTAIHYAVSEILMTIHNWMKYSNYTTKRV